MATLADLQSTYDQLMPALAARDAAYQVFQNQINAIDPASATAQSDLDAVKAGIDTWKQQNSSNLTTLAQTMISQAESIPADDVASGQALVNSFTNANSGINLTVNAAVDSTQSAISSASNAADPSSTVKTPGATNPDPTAGAGNDGGIDNSAQTGATVSADTGATGGWSGVGLNPNAGGTGLNPNAGGTGLKAAIPKGAMPALPQAAVAQWSAAKDLRVKLRVPNEYLTGPAAGPANIIQKNGGILFPYTPTISMENAASYAQQSPLHSNYAQYFYKSSSVGPITVTAKFTVQNEYEGAVLLGVIHLLRGLTKMKWGNDPDAGSPPPVCRFDAYGDFMLNNVPVSIASWRHELPDNVDYISVGRPGSPSTYGHSMVPSLSTINITLNVMYSRREMLAYNVKDWQSGSLKNRGYL